MKKRMKKAYKSEKKKCRQQGNLCFAKRWLFNKIADINEKRPTALSDKEKGRIVNAHFLNVERSE